MNVWVIADKKGKPLSTDEVSGEHYVPAYVTKGAAERELGLLNELYPLGSHVVPATLTVHRRKA